MGFSLRTKVHIAWLGSTLRLEARDKRLELRPTAQGIVAAYIENGQETRSEALRPHGQSRRPGARVARLKDESAARWRISDTYAETWL